VYIFRYFFCVQKCGLLTYPCGLMSSWAFVLWASVLWAFVLHLIWTAQYNIGA